MSAPGPADDLLGQILGLIQQYVSQGGDPSPILDIVEQAAGGGAPDGGAADAGGMPPDAGAAGPPMPGQAQDMGGPIPDMAGMAPDQPPTSSPGGNPLRGASDAALADVMKRKKR